MRAALSAAALTMLSLTFGLSCGAERRGACEVGAGCARPRALLSGRAEGVGRAHPEGPAEVLGRAAEFDCYFACLFLVLVVSGQRTVGQGGTSQESRDAELAVQCGQP